MLNIVYTENLKAAKENKGQGNRRILPHWRSLMGIQCFYTIQIVYVSEIESYLNKFGQWISAAAYQLEIRPT